MTFGLTLNCSRCVQHATRYIQWRAGNQWTKRYYCEVHGPVARMGAPAVIISMAVAPA